MTRSRGIAVVAMLVLLGGSWQVLGLLSFRAPRPGMVSTQRAKMERVLQQAEADRNITREKIAELRQQAEQALQVSEEAQRAPTAQVIRALNGLLGLVAVIAAIGLLVGRDWSRKLLMWQAGVSIPFSIWSTMWHIPLQQRVLESFSVMSIRTQKTMPVWIGVIGVLLAIAWSGFILWFMNRSAVKQ